MKSSTLRIPSLILSAAITLASGLTGQSATIIKANNTDNLNLTTSWVDGVVPTSSDVAQWDSTVTAANTVLLGADTNWAGILVTNPGGAVIISAGNTLTLGSAGIDMSGASQNLTLNNTVLLGAGQTWNVASGRSLTVAAGLGGSSLLTKSGAGYVYVSTGNTNSGGWSITGGGVQTSSSGNTTTILGTGNLNLSNGGRVRFNSTSGATVNQPAIDLGTGGGILSFRGNSYYGSPTLSGSGALTIQPDSGVVVTPTSFSGWNGTIIVTAGTLRLDNSFVVNSMANAAVQLSAGVTLNKRNGTTPNTAIDIGTLSGPAGCTLGGSGTGGGYWNYSVGGRNEDATFGGNIVQSSAGNSPTAITKVGTGTWTISGTNTYTGPTLVSTGALYLATGGTISNTASITVASNATFGVRIATAGGKATGTNLVFSAGTNFLVFNYGTVAPSTTTAPLLLLSNITANGAVHISVLGGAGWAVGPYPLVKYSGAIAGTGSITNVRTLPLQVSATVSNDAVNSVLYLVVSASSEPLRWKVGSGAWDIGVSANWTNAIGTTTTYQEQLGLGDQVVFDDSGTGPSIAVTLNTNVTPQSVTVSNANNSYSLSGSGAIAGTVGLTKQGAGTLTLGTTNTFTGAANLNGGIVNFTTLANLGAGTAINFGGGTLQYASGNTTDISTRTVTANAGGATIDTAGNNVTFANRIGNNGAGGLAKTGTGILTLNSNATHSGNTTLTQGTLALGANGSLSNSAAIVVGSGTVLDVSVPGSLALNGLVGQVLAGSGVVTGSVTVGASTVVTPVTNGTIGTLSFTNDLTLDGGTFNLDVSTASRDLIKVGGTLNLNSGTFNVNVVGSPLANGTYKLIQYAGYNYGLGGGNVLLAGFSQAGQIAFLDDSVPGEIDLIVQAASSLNLTWAGDGGGNAWDVGVSATWLTNPATPLTLFGNGDRVLFDNSSAYLSVSLAANVFPSSVQVASTNDYTFTAGGGKIAGSVGLTKSSSGKLTILAPNTYFGPTVISGGTLQVGDGSTYGATIGAGNITNNAALVFNQPDDFTLQGPISGTGTLTKAGAGTLTLLGNNTYGGSTTIDTGTLQIGNGGTLGTPGTAAITLANGGTLTLNRSGVQTFANGISGDGTFRKNGSSTLTLGGVNTYLQNTYINNGTLKLAAANVIPSGGTTTGWLFLDGGATAAGILDLNGFDQTVNGLSGLTGTVRGQILNNGGSGVNTLTIDGAAGLADTTYAGAIADNSGTGGSVALVKRGTSNLTLSRANNTYTGGTTLYDGTVTVSSTTSSGGHLGTGQVTFRGGTLASGFGGGARCTIGNALYVPAGASGTILMTTMTSLTGTLTGGGTLTISVVGATDSRFDGSWNAFTGTINLYGGGTARLRINGANFDSLTGSTVTMTNVTMEVSCNSYGNTVNVGALIMDSSAKVGGSYYAGGLTLSVGALNQPDLIAGTFTDDAGGGSTSLTKVGSNTLTLTGTMSHRGNTTVNGGTLLVGPSSFMSSSALITVAAGATIDFSAAALTTFSAGQTLGGSGVVTGSVALVATDILSPGASAGTLSFSNNLSMASVTNAFELSSDPTGLKRANDLVIVAGNLTVTGLNPLNLTALNTALAPGIYPLFKYGGTLNNEDGVVPVGTMTNFVIGGPFAGQTLAGLSVSNAGHQIVLVVTGGPSLVWLGGDGATNRWDVTNTLSWAQSGVQTNFAQLDSVTFDDTASNLVAMLSGNLGPNLVTVNTTNTYGFGSSGKLSGAMSLTKGGTGMLVVSNTTANDYDGQVTINGGTLKAAVASALGSTNSGTIINNSGTLDVGGMNLGAEPVTVATGGAVGNSGVSQTYALRFVTLTGDATFTGPMRWDIRTNATASLTGNGHKLTKTGTNDVYLVDLGETGLGDIDVQQGRLCFQNNTTMGSSGSTLSVGTGAGIDLYDTTITNNKVVHMTAATLSSTSGTNYFSGPIAITGTGTFTATTPLTLSGSISGGSLVKDGAGKLTLAVANSYTGTTTVSNGTLAVATAAAISSSPTIDVAAGILDVTALSGSQLVLGSGQTLKGNGTIVGSVNEAANSFIAPGESVGTLTVTGTVTLAGNTIMEINKGGEQTSDRITSASISYGGTLTLTSVGSALAPNDFFQLFSVSGAKTGAFVKIEGSPGDGLAWYTDNLPIDGTIAVVATVKPSITYSLSGSQLTLSWPSGYRLLAQTNSVGVGLTTNWVDTGVTASPYVITVDPAKGSVFYGLSQ